MPKPDEGQKNETMGEPPEFVTTPICWVCQSPIRPDGCVVISDYPLAVCKKCWDQISVEHRVRLGFLFEDRRAGGPATAIARLCDLLSERLESPGGLSEWIERGRN